MISIINRILWSLATALIVMAGVYFTYRLRFVQFRFRDMFQNLFVKKKKKDTISPFQSLMIVLAGRIGVGSIAGVALAIYLGGIGSIFWMWVIAFISSANAFAETVLGVIYKQKDKGNIYKGGPSYYIKNGLGKRKLGNIYAILIIVSYIGGFLGIQANTITKSLNEIIAVPPFIVAGLVCILTSLIIFGGISKIAKTSEKIVPVMTILYIGVAFYILIVNINVIPSILGAIVKDAFRLNAFFSGFLTSIIVGVQRGIFSNEAGLGTGAIAASTIDTDRPATQGFVQMIGIYITTMLICTATAIVILTSNYGTLNLTDVNGIEITQYAFQYHLGNTGSIIVFLSIVLFSFSTILSGYYDGESSLKYFFKEIKNKYLLILKIVTIGVLFAGCIMPSSFLWNLVDIMVALLAIINIYAILSLRKEVVEDLTLYDQEKKKKD